MKATCPKDPKHNRFVTTAHVAQEWVVDEHGDFIKEYAQGMGSEVTQQPSRYNIWTCYKCGAEAIVEDSD